MDASIELTKQTCQGHAMLTYKQIGGYVYAEVLKAGKWRKLDNHEAKITRDDRSLRIALTSLNERRLGGLAIDDLTEFIAALADRFRQCRGEFPSQLFANVTGAIPLLNAVSQYVGIGVEWSERNPEIGSVKRRRTPIRRVRDDGSLGDQISLHDVLTPSVISSYREIDTCQEFILFFEICRASSTR